MISTAASLRNEAEEKPRVRTLTAHFATLLTFAVSEYVQPLLKISHNITQDEMILIIVYCNP